MVYLVTFAGIVAFIVVLVLIIEFFDRKRRDAVQAVAQSMGLKFEAKADHVLGLEFGQLALFNKGHGKKAKNLLSGAVEDIDLRIFDYQYTVGGGRNSSTYVQTVAVVSVRLRDLPAFELRPEGLFHRIGQMFGYQDIDFADYPAFSKRYLLRGADEQAIRQVFAGELIEYLEQRDKICIEAAGRYLMVYRHGKRVKQDDLSAFVETAFEVATRFDR